MISLFYGRSGVQHSIRYSEHFNNIKDMMEIDIVRLTTYYRNSSRSVNNSDFLIRLMRSINADVRLNKFDFFTILDARTKYIEKTAGITSNASFGRIITLLEGDAIILSVDLGIDYMGIEKTWEDMAPIRPLNTNTTDLSMPHPANVEHAFTGYILDTNLMMLMWYHYANTHPNPQMGYFVYRYVYTNMIPYFLDHAIVNIFLGLKPTPFKNTNPINIINQNKKIYRYTKLLNDKTKDGRLYYEEVMLNLRLIKSRDMLELFIINAPFFTKQSRHGIFFMYKDVMLNLMVYLGDRGIRYNQPVIKDLYLLTQRMLSSKSIEAIDYGIYKEDVGVTLQLIYEISKNRRI